MPTKDRLEDIDEEIVRYLLHKYLKEVNSVVYFGYFRMCTNLLLS